MVHHIQATRVAARVTGCIQGMLKFSSSRHYCNDIFPMLVAGFVASCASESQNFKKDLT